jgi:hypothetical protein
MRAEAVLRLNRYFAQVDQIVAGSANADERDNDRWRR